MPKWLIVLLFIAGAALSWGVYVPSIHKATGLVGSNLRAFLLVGVAYFLTAVLVPVLLIFVLKWDPTIRGTPNFASPGIRWGLFAGTMGAAGALCVIFAAVNAGKGGAIYVAPLVFAGAPIVNTFVTLDYFHPTKTSPDWRFLMGLLLAAAGMVMVVIYKPTDDEVPSAKPTAVAASQATAAPPVH